MIKIPISSLRAERRNGTAEFTWLNPETNEVRTDEIPISFLKPTEALWEELGAMEEAAKGEDENARKELLVRQLVRVEIQSPAIVEDDGRPYNITADDLHRLDLMQVAQLMTGVQKHFFLQTPQSNTETATNSSSEQAES